MKHGEFKITIEHDNDDDWELCIDDARFCKKDPAEIHSQVAGLFAVCEDILKVVKEHSKD